MSKGIFLLYAIFFWLNNSESTTLGTDHGCCMCEPIRKHGKVIGTNFKCVHFREGNLKNMTIPEHCNVSNLKTVDFSHNEMSNISKNTFISLNKRMMANITQMYLVADSITNIDRNTFQQFTSLRYVDLQNNKLTQASLMSAFGYLKNNIIKSLRLDMNKIESLSSATFKHLPHLQDLYLTNNVINSISNGTFAGLQKLQVLDLRNNRLKGLELDGLNGLMKLFLDQNKLCAIPRFMRGNECIFTNLSVLQLSNNAITSSDQFVDDRKCLSKLRTLTLGGNKIHAVSPNVFDNFALQHLDISNFPLANWSQQMMGNLLKSQTRLKNLSMKECGLEKLPENTFSSLMYLKELYLNDNRISTWTATTLVFGKDMHFLDLQGNKIRLINQSTFPDTPRTMDLSRNPFLCDCRLQWFRNWIKLNSGRLYGEATHYKCEFPQNLKNKNLKDFNPTYVDCNPWNPYVIVAIVICVTLVLLVLFATIIQSCKDRFRFYLKRKRQYDRIPDLFDHTEIT